MEYTAKPSFTMLERKTQLTVEVVDDEMELFDTDER